MMREWLAGCMSLLLANLTWQLIVYCSGGLGTGAIDLIARTVYMLAAFGLWTMFRKRWF